MFKIIAHDRTGEEQTSHEVLGDAKTARYASQQEAQAIADELQADAEQHWPGQEVTYSVTHDTETPTWISDETTLDIYTNWHADAEVTFDRMAGFGDREPDEAGAVWTVAGVLRYLEQTGFTLAGCAQPRDGVIRNAAGDTIIEVIA